MKLPDGPRTLPFLQKIQGIVDPLKFLDECAQCYGDPFTSQFGGFTPQVIISNPQAIQKIFTADPRQLDSGQAGEALRSLVGDYSLFLLDGNRHKRQRHLLTPPFHGERMRTYGKLICEITHAVLNQWTIGKPFSVRSSIQEICFRVILRTVFGIDEGERFQQLRQLLGSLMDSLGSPWRSSLLFFPFLQQDFGSCSPWGHFLRQRQQIDELIYAEIQQRRVEPNQFGEDILSLMMVARDEAGQPMTDAELRDELMTLLAAAYDTPASAVAWALYWIHYLPEVRKKLFQELDTLSHNPDPVEISRLPYLNAVCQETLRIYPIILFTFPRIVKSPLQLMGYEFNPGTVLVPCIYLTHHREDLYPQPKCFKPERFLERQFSPYEYLPFGGGNRRCIGFAFAQLKMKLILATVLSRFQLTLADDRPVYPVRRGITLSPSKGVQMVAIKKCHSQLANLKSEYQSAKLLVTK